MAVPREAVADLIYAEGWQFFWLAWVIAATLAALYRCSRQTFLTSLMLLAGWFLTNIFWNHSVVYVVSDVAFFAMTYGLWRQSREGHILTVATVYTLMWLVHWISPPFPAYMVALNLLYGIQLSAITAAAIRGCRTT